MLSCNKFMLVGTTVWYVGGTSLHIVAAVLNSWQHRRQHKEFRLWTLAVATFPWRLWHAQWAAVTLLTPSFTCVWEWEFLCAATSCCRLLAGRYNSIAQAGWKIVLMLLCKQNKIWVSRWLTWKPTCSSCYLCKWAACQWLSHRRKFVWHVSSSHQVREATHFLH